jgi:hypothetical protein
MLYYAVINLGLGEIGPSNCEEYYFCVGSMIISAFVFTNLVSSFMSLSDSMNAESNEQ